MTKFLKQDCQLELAQRNDDGSTVLNDYGDIVYTPVETIKCRREGTAQDVQTGTGAIVKVSTRYFVDEKIEVRADDRIDGHVVLAASEYTNELGRCEGYECYV